MRTPRTPLRDMAHIGPPGRDVSLPEHCSSAGEGGSAYARVTLVARRDARPYPGEAMLVYKYDSQIDLCARAPGYHTPLAEE